LFGENGTDVLYGGSGSDYLDGGHGRDWLIGGLGDDTYVVDNSCEKIIEQPNEGTDTVLSSVTYTLPSNVEKLTLTGNHSINGSGNSSDNVLTGNSGNNTLSGGSGNDTLTGNAGKDRLFGSSGKDTLVGGSGNDALAGGIHSDRYVLGKGAGQDSIYESCGSDPASLPGDSSWDVVQFTDVQSTELSSVRRKGKDLEIRYGSGDRVTVRDQFKPGSGGYGIEEILFSDGVSWDRATIAAKATSGHGCGHGHEWKSNETKARVYNQVDLLVSAMAGFAPTASSHTVVHDDRRSFVQPLLAVNFK
jgi:Ca2+-binding RTX toxin-like protein